MSGQATSRERVDMRRGARELALAALTVLAVALAVAAVVFGLIVVLYDHGQHVAHAAVGVGLLHR